MENEKITHDDGSLYNAADEQEDQKMEEFFALIRNFQEARNRRKDTEEEEKEKERKKKIRRVNEEETSWVPSFEWEDFNEEIQFRRPPVIFPLSCNQKEENKQQDKDDGLDLKLTL